jgi:O-antigen ligase
MMQAIASEQDTVRLWNTIPQMIETGIILLVLFLFSEGLLGPLLASEEQPDGNPILRLMWLPTYAVVVGLAVLRTKSLLLTGLRMPVLVLLLMVTVASVQWSIDPGLTMRRAFAVVMTTGFGVHLANRYNWQEMLTLFGLIWFFLAALSFVISIGMPAIGLEQDGDHAGAWRGLWFQKNALGGHMSRSAFLFGFLTFANPALRKVWIVGLLMSIGLVMLTTSKTALVGLLLGFGILATGFLMKRGARLALVVCWLAVVFVGLFGALLVFQPDVLVGLIGRDLTLTGRTDIWEALRYVIADRPWLGHGYGAFWGIGSGPAEYVKDLVQWDVPTAHNGWMETWLSVGLVGVLLFALGYVATILRALSLSFSSWTGVFALGFLAQFFLFNLSESMILQQNSIVWVSYVAISAALLRQRVSGAPPRDERLVRRERDLLPITGVRHTGMSNIRRSL